MYGTSYACILVVVNGLYQDVQIYAPDGSAQLDAVGRHSRIICRNKRGLQHNYVLNRSPYSPRYTKVSKSITLPRGLCHL